MIKIIFRDQKLLSVFVIVLWFASSVSLFEYKILSIFIFGFAIIFSTPILSYYVKLLRYPIRIKSIFINPGSTNFSKKDFEELIEETINSFSAYYNGRKILSENTIFINIIENRIGLDKKNAKCNHNKSMKVIFNNNGNLYETSMRHQLGHFILSKCVENSDINNHHDIMKQIGL